MQGTHVLYIILFSIVIALAIHFSPWKMKVKEKEIVERCDAPKIVGSNLTLYKRYPNQMGGHCLCKFLYVSIMLVNCKSSKK